MKLSDIMSAAGLAWFAEAALVLFLVAFATVCVSVFSKRNARRLDAARFLPLEDAPAPSAAPRPLRTPEPPPHLGA